MKVKVLVAQSCLTLCNMMDCSPPGFSVHKISQARILEWVAIPFSSGSSQPMDRTQISYIAGKFFISVLPGKPIIIIIFYPLVQLSSVAQSCPTLCDPMDCSLPRSSVRGIFQARVLEWVVISFFRGSSQPRD